MPKIFSIIILALLLIACKQEVATDTDSGASSEMVDLQNQIKQLELDNALKDSVINESLAFFNDIKSNLESIGVRKDEIRALSNDPEMENHDKEWILEQIRHINFLREDNARKVKRLNEEIKNNGLKIDELEVMMKSLLKEIQWKDEQIHMLEDELNQLDEEYSKLFSAYQEQALEIETLTEDLHAVYYAYGTERELKDNGVIEKKNGFVGIGKKISLSEELNDSYFTKANATKTKQITIQGKKVHFITSHPTSSYELEEQGNKTILKINDASEFWKISKYLVITVK